MATLPAELSHPLRSFALELTLELGAGTLALVGPSGAGKSSVLRAVAGLLRPRRAGSRWTAMPWLDTARGIDVPPERRSVGLLFQDYALFPHLSVRRNVAFGARNAVRGRRAARAVPHRHLAGARPEEISGGERQRVALARALARDPECSCSTSRSPRSTLTRGRRCAASCMSYSRGSGCRSCSSRTTSRTPRRSPTGSASSSRGGFVQVGTPSELVAAPRDPFVARFTGANLVPGAAAPDAGGLTEVVLDGGRTMWSTDAAAGRVALDGLPVGDLALADVPDDSAVNHLRAPVARITRWGTASVSPSGRRRGGHDRLGRAAQTP